MAGSERGIYPRWGGDWPVPEPVLHHGERQKHHPSGGNPSGFS